MYYSDPRINVSIKLGTFHSVSDVDEYSFMDRVKDIEPGDVICVHRSFNSWFYQITLEGNIKPVIDSDLCAEPPAFRYKTLQEWKEASDKYFRYKDIDHKFYKNIRTFNHNDIYFKRVNRIFGSLAILIIYFTYLGFFTDFSFQGISLWNYWLAFVFTGWVVIFVKTADILATAVISATHWLKHAFVFSINYYWRGT